MGTDPLRRVTHVDVQATEQNLALLRTAINVPLAPARIHPRAVAAIRALVIISALMLATAVVLIIVRAVS